MAACSLRIILSRNLKIFRTNKKVTQDQLEELSGVSKYTISDIETCESWPKDETLEKLAKALEIQTADFFDTLEDPLKNLSVREDILEQVKTNIKKNLDDIIGKMKITYNTNHKL